VDLTLWVEVGGLLLGGGSLGALGTYLGIRKKTQSDLEIAYMSQLNRAFVRIEQLEKARDDHWVEIRKVVTDEREACDKRISEIETKFESRLREIQKNVDEISEVHEVPPG
jgi:hypothetical protein